ncbi:MAG: GNAT family N-acetyltransferase [Mariniphaga sp.]|nr:GNAT family N-acetyltransferase [Mariniphaga sp.]
MSNSKIIDITPDNIAKHGMFCLKNVKNPGFPAKQNWFNEQYTLGLRFKIIKNDEDEIAAFIEYIPSEHTWRPVKVANYLFIHCMMTYPKKNHGKGFATELISQCEREARSEGKSGLVAVTSKGTWLADKKVFLKNGFAEVSSKGRFELLAKKFDSNSIDPEFIDWENQAEKFKGWNLIYANQCPYHKKASDDLVKTAKEFGVKLKVIILKNSKEAQNAPSGFGVFSLINDGKLLEDHYISSTRFKNILKKELKR